MTKNNEEPFAFLDDFPEDEILEEKEDESIVEKRKRLSKLAEESGIGLTAQIKKQLEESLKEKDKTKRREKLKEILDGVSLTQKIKKRIEEEYKRREKMIEERKRKLRSKESPFKDEKPPEIVNLSQNEIKPMSVLEKVVEDKKATKKALSSTKRARLRQLANDAQIGLTAKIKRSIAKRLLHKDPYANEENISDVQEMSFMGCLGWIIAIICLAILTAFLFEKLLGG